jgi:hypothetical protein
MFDNIITATFYKTTSLTMKQVFRFLTFCSLFFSIPALAQAPQKFSYQAVARDATGNPLVNTDISVRMNINNGMPLGPTIYSERHNVTTNQFGLFTLQIGAGTVISGTFTSINWGSGDKYLATALDDDGSVNGYTFMEMGTTQLLSVPYALYAGQSSNGWNLTGNTDTNPTTDFIGTNDAQPLLFKVAGIKAGEINSLTYNTAWGVSAMRFNTNGLGNTSLGYQTLYNNTTGNYNLAIGPYALFNNVGNSRSTAIGYNSMSNTDNSALGLSTFNTAIGYESLKGSSTPANNTGKFNTAVGDKALFANTSGDSNVAIGVDAIGNEQHRF